MVQVELRHLRYFVAVAEELNFGRAAGVLNLSQPPLSKQIKDLEIELGTALFLRTKRHVELTTAGHELLPYAKDILRMAEEARARVRKASAGDVGTLAVGFTGTTIFDLQAIVRMFNQAHPDVEIVLRRMGTTDQRSALKDRSISIGHLILPLPDLSLEVLPIRTDPFVVALPSTHSIAQGTEPINLSSLVRENFIITPRDAGTSYHDAVLSLCLQGGFVPRIGLEMDYIESIPAFISLGMGVSLVPVSLSNIKIQGVVYKTIDAEKPVMETALAWRKDDRSPIVRSFVECAIHYREASVNSRSMSNAPYYQW